jgi:hypothetical protein
VIEYTVVLANGTIVTASNSSNPDLYLGLKGGGNSYGIVTSFLLQAHPQGQVWGGTYSFSIDKTDELLEAVRDFTEYYPDEKAGIILTTETTLAGGLDLWIMFLCYDGPTPPAGVFDNFTAVGPLSETTKTQSYHELVTANNAIIIKGSIYTIATESTTLPNSTVGLQVMRSYYDHWRDVTEPVLGAAGLIASMAFQPIPKRLVRKAIQMGGDMIALDDSADRIMMEFDYSYLLATDTPAVDAANVALVDGLKERCDAFIA